jgi:hypothetical protein
MVATGHLHWVQRNSGMSAFMDSLFVVVGSFFLRLSSIYDSLESNFVGLLSSFIGLPFG